MVCNTEWHVRNSQLWKKTVPGQTLLRSTWLKGCSYVEFFINKSICTVSITFLLVHSSEGATALLVSNYSHCSECLSFLYDVWIRLLSWQISVSHCTNPAGWPHDPLEEVTWLSWTLIACASWTVVNVYISASNREKACASSWCQLSSSVIICSCCSVTLSFSCMCTDLQNHICRHIIDLTWFISQNLL